MYSVIAGVLLVKVFPSSLRTKPPPKKCLTGPSVGVSGVGESGSTIAITKGPLPNSAGTGGRRANVGGPAVVAIHAKRNQFCRLWYVVQGQTIVRHTIFRRLLTIISAFTVWRRGPGRGLT